MVSRKKPNLTQRSFIPFRPFVLTYAVAKGTKSIGIDGTCLFGESWEEIESGHGVSVHLKLVTTYFIFCIMSLQDSPSPFRAALGGCLHGI